MYKAKSSKSVRIRKDLHKDLKLIAIQEEKSFQKMVELACQAYINSWKKSTLAGPTLSSIEKDNNLKSED